MKKVIILFLLISTILGQAVYAAPTEKPVNKQLIQNILNTAYEHLTICEHEYKAISEKFNKEKPFNKLLRRQEPYMDMLMQLYKEYGLNAPNVNTSIRIPNTLDEFYQNSLAKEKNLIESYRGFLKEEMPQEVRSAIHRLIELSGNNARVYKFILEAKKKGSKAS